MIDMPQKTHAHSQTEYVLSNMRSQEQIKCVFKSKYGLWVSVCVILSTYVLIFFFFFLIQFNVPFKIISLIETSQWVGGAKQEYPGKAT